jgi:hypothetical protein
MPPPRRLLALRTVLHSLPVWDSAPALGTLILGAPGAGKTILLSLLLLGHLIRGLPGVVLDPLGTLSDAFLFRLLWFLSEYPPGDDEFLWQRLRYIELGGDAITPFPLYYQRNGESLWDAAMRLITVLERANPQLVTQSPLTWPAARRLAVNAGMLVTAMGYQLPKMQELLFNTSEWEQSGKFQEAINRNPKATDAVSYFQNYYLLLPRSEQRRIAGTFLDQVYPFLQNPQLRAIFCGRSTPGIDWEEEEAVGRIVIINAKGIPNQTSRSFSLQWLFESLYPHLKTRGRRQTPFVLLIDEFAHLSAVGTAENKPLADLFDELLAQYARNNRVFVTAALQSVDQVSERLQQTLFRLGTLITGRAGSVREARVIADHLVRKDINRVHHYKKVWGKHDPPPFFSRARDSYEDALGTARLTNASYPYFVLDLEPAHMPLETQTEDHADMIQQLQPLEFLCCPVRSEAARSPDVSSLSLHDAVTDPDTGEDIFPDPDRDARLLAQIQHQLAACSGVPIAEILKEQESQLPQGTLNPAPHTADNQHPFPLPDKTQPAQRNTKTTPSLPTLTDEERSFLHFLMTHPDAPLASVYAGLQVSSRKGNNLRERLASKGFLTELEVRTSRIGAGRPTKFVIPTLAAVEVLGADPPNGRGGVIHRALQHAVATSAESKGYQAKVEYPLGNGAIVDVYLEKGTEKVGVEIAIVSRVGREVAHLRSALAADLTSVFGLFADEKLMAQTAQLVTNTFSVQEQGRVRLLPLSQLSHIG